MKRIFLTTAIVLGLALPLGALAANENIRLESQAWVEVVKVNDRGEKVIEREPAALVLPGTMVIYTNRYTNDGPKAAEQVAITNPVPAEMEYLGGSAIGKGTTASFSIDGGKVFDTPEKLTVTEKDGKRRLAEPKEYTHVRWTLTAPVPPGGGGEVEYRARLK